jgi:hypothetical protein
VSRKVLTIDIETSPHLCYSFNVWNTNISPVHIVEPSRMISFAAKWEGDRRVMFHSEFNFDNPHVYGSPDSRAVDHGLMVQAAFDLLDHADVVVTYNGDRFDLRRLGQEFRLAGLGQPSPFASVDLYKVIKSEEDWLSHKLAYITERYHLTGKLEAGVDFSLWRGCLEGDPKMWRLMRRYNKRDVVTTEEVFHEVSDLPMNLPALALFDDEPLAEGHCPVCRQQGQRRGYAYTKTRRYPRYYCVPCKKWFRGSRSDRSAGIA